MASFDYLNCLNTLSLLFQLALNFLLISKMSLLTKGFYVHSTLKTLKTIFEKYFVKKYFSFWRSGTSWLTEHFIFGGFFGPIKFLRGQI